MVDIRIKNTGSDTIISCNGHATGDPAVCAAVSALVGQFRPWAARDLSPVAYRIQEGKGEFKATLPEKESLQQVAFFCAGISRLIATHPDLIRFSIE